MLFGTESGTRYLHESKETTPTAHVPPNGDGEPQVLYSMWVCMSFKRSRSIEQGWGNLKSFTPCGTHIVGMYVVSTVMFLCLTLHVGMYLFSTAMFHRPSLHVSMHVFSTVPNPPIPFNSQSLFKYVFPAHMIMLANIVDGSTGSCELEKHT